MKEIKIKIVFETFICIEIMVTEKKNMVCSS